MAFNVSCQSVSTAREVTTIETPTHWSFANHTCTKFLHLGFDKGEKTCVLALCPQSVVSPPIAPDLCLVSNSCVIADMSSLPLGLSELCRKQKACSASDRRVAKIASASIPSKSDIMDSSWMPVDTVEAPSAGQVDASAALRCELCGKAPEKDSLKGSEKG